MIEKSKSKRKYEQKDQLGYIKYRIVLAEKRLIKQLNEHICQQSVESFASENKI